jgi:proton-dependent oligopeptide transporter, POT family
MSEVSTVTLAGPEMSPIIGNQKYATVPAPSSEMPRGIPYIVGNEAAERFSYYGVVAILVVFLTHHLRDASGSLATLEEHRADEWGHHFSSACYFFPIFGAILSDWFLGKYRTIMAVSILYCAGHAALALMDFPELTGLDPKVMLFAGLALIAVGAGGIKPCVSAHVGDQFGAQNQHLMSNAFGWFYFSTNVGSTVSMFLTPVLLEKYGPGWAFGVPGIFMALAAFVFWLGRFKFVHVPPGGREFIRDAFSPTSLRAIGSLIPLYCFMIPFFALYFQTYFGWVHQAEHMNRTIFGYTLLPAQVQDSNSVFVVLFIPLFTYLIYPILGRWFEVRPLRKIGIGMFFIALAFAVVGLIQTRIDAGETPHVGWQIFAYAIVTAGEVTATITAMEFSYTQAPKKLKSFVMGTFWLTLAAGNEVAALVNGYIANKKEQGVTILEGANYFWFFTALMLITAIAYVIWSPFYRGRTFIQGEAA